MRRDLNAGRITTDSKNQSPQGGIVKFQRQLRTFAWLGIFAVLSFFSIGKAAFPLAAWLAPIFALHVTRRRKPFQGALLIALAGYLPALLSFKGATVASMIHPAADYVFFLITALLSSLPYLFDRIILGWAEDETGRVPFWATLAFPFAATALDYLTTGNSAIGTFGASGYSQFGLTPVMQLASITGIWGLTFVTSWFASAVAWAWSLNFEWRAVRRGAIALTVIVVLLVGYGSLRLLLHQTPVRTVTVGGYAGEASIGTLLGMLESSESSFEEAVTQSHANYLSQTRDLAAQGAHIILWSEGAGIGYEAQVQTLVEAGATLADELDIYLAMPTFTLYQDEGRKPENALVIADPSGAIVLEHVKYGGSEFEGSLPGSKELQTVETPYGTLSGIICWDADFPNVVAQAGRRGVDLLLIPSNDWFEVRNIHAEMAVFRGVENATAIFRQTSHGVSLASDAMGRVLHRQDTFEDQTTQLVDVPLHQAEASYPALGDWMGIASPLGLVGVGLVGAMKRKRH
jgi:apolipoprotein N-acyltransferase